jgi:hypothetical protein
VSRYLPPEAPPWAEQLAQLVLSARATGGGLRPVMTLSEAMVYTACASSSAYYRWLQKWAPRACCGHGRFTLAALSAGLDREAMSTRGRSRRQVRLKAIEKSSATEGKAA